MKNNYHHYYFYHHRFYYYYKPGDSSRPCRSFPEIIDVRTVEDYL